MRKLVAAVALGMIAGVAQAEVIAVTGEFPAGNREASFLRSIVVGRIGGQDGPALQIAVERALANSQFAVLGGRTGRNVAEGEISGAVSTSVDEQPFKKREKQCVERAPDGKKCIKEAQVEIACRRRIASVDADIRVTRNRDGRILLSRPVPFREELTWCQPSGRPGRTVQDAISAAIQGVADALRGELVPYVSTYNVRVRETTKGLAKPAAARFKALVTQTKRDARGACAGWQAMRGEAGLAMHPSLLFNLGVCAEASGDYAAASALYRDAVAAGAGEGREAADRAVRLIAGRDDARERARRR